MTSAAASANPQPTKSRTEQFDCVDCGHRFRRRTRAGIHTGCPKCGGISLGGQLKERLVASAARNVETVDASRARRSREAAARRKGEGGPAPDGHGGNSDGGSEAVDSGPRTAPGNAAPRRPSPQFEAMPPALRVVPPPAAAEPAAHVTPISAGVEPPRRRVGILGRLIGAPDEGEYV